MTSPLKRDDGDVTAVTSREQEVALEAEDQRHAQERERGLARRRRIIEQLQGEGLVLVLIVVFVVMWASSQFFLTEQNLLTAASVVSVLGVMAVAETLLVIAGEIDISIGSVMAATSVLMGVMVGAGINVWLAAIIGLLFSGAVGVVNGVITVYFKINSLVTTLGTYSIFLGVAYAVSNTATTSIGGAGFEELGSGKIGPVPVPVFFFLGLWLIGLLHIPLAKVEHYRQTFSAHAYMIMVQGATPIPYKLVTIASGLAGVPFFAFMFFSAITRSFRFVVLEGLLVHFFGDQAKALLEKYLEVALIVFLTVVVLGVVAAIYL